MLDRLPTSEEAEAAVICGVMLDNGLLAEAATLRPDQFSSRKYREMFEAVLELGGEHSAIDPITVYGKLKARGSELTVVDASSVMDTIPRLESLDTYIKAVQRKAALRAAVHAAHGGMQALCDDDADEETILSIATALVSTADAYEVEEKLAQIDGFSYMQQMEARLSGEEAPEIETGYRQLDQMLGGGLYRGKLYTVMGRPGGCKTAFATCIGLRAAKAGHVVARFDLEMDRAEMTERSIGYETGIDTRRIRYVKQLTKDEWKWTAEALGELEDLPLYATDAATMHLEDILAQCRRLHRIKGRLNLVIVDYIQLVRLANNRGIPDRLVIGIACKALRRLGKELGFAVIICSQMSRDIEKRGGDKVAKMSDAAEAGAIEQDSDVMIHPSRQEPEATAPNVEEIVLDVVKHRGGPVGAVSLLFAPAAVRVLDPSETAFLDLYWERTLQFYGEARRVANG